MLSYEISTIAKISSKLKKLANEEYKRRAVGKRSSKHASILKSPTSALPPTNISLNTEHKKDDYVSMSGLIGTRFYTTSEYLVSILVSTVGDTLQYPKDE